MVALVVVVVVVVVLSFGDGDDPRIDIGLHCLKEPSKVKFYTDLLRTERSRDLHFFQCSIG